MLEYIGFTIFFFVIILLLVFKVSPVPVFIIVPVLGALVSGFSIQEIGEMIESGLMQVMNIGIMFIFAMLFFGIISDAGLFNPLTDKLKKMAGNNIILITIATALIAMVSHLDGSGASTLLITIPALLPVYKRLQMNPLLLLLIVALSAGVMNLVPWGGPLARVAAVLGVDPGELWVPLIPVQITGIILVLCIAIYLGIKEKRRVTYLQNVSNQHVTAASDENYEMSTLVRPKLWWFNFTLTSITIITLVLTSIPFSTVFMMSFSIALFVNYPNGALQVNRIRAHATEAFMLTTILLAAGAFLGVINGTGMVEQMTIGLLSIIPEGLSTYLHIIIGIFSVPLLFILPPDAYLFAFVSLIVEVVGQYGVPPKSAVYAIIIGATIGGYVSPLIPATYLAIGLAKVDLVHHIRYSLCWIWGLSIILLFVAVLLGIVTII
ncbi:CitMHS family transporter [Bacillus sp. FJAT-45350]|uniref:CitMHS family transporter n=1 Tax=Bacillus sp. FJAT-45350 TaxID=2011014 RepID=UPI0015CC62F8|nr:citrate:proton symporter [Bacillus sp. FJAT-45350]